MRRLRPGVGRTTDQAVFSSRRSHHADHRHTHRRVRGRGADCFLETECRADGPELERLAELVLSGEGPAGQAPVPDGFRYVIRIDSKLVELQDPYLTEDQRQLIDAVLAAAA